VISCDIREASPRFINITYGCLRSILSEKTIDPLRNYTCNGQCLNGFCSLRPFPTCLNSWHTLRTHSNHNNELLLTPTRCPVGTIEVPPVLSTQNSRLPLIQSPALPPAPPTPTTHQQQVQAAARTDQGQVTGTLRMETIRQLAAAKSWPRRRQARTSLKGHSTA
jgi:hypothetical protein